MFFTAKASILQAALLERTSEPRHLGAALLEGDGHGRFGKGGLGTSGDGGLPPTCLCRFGENGKAQTTSLAHGTAIRSGGEHDNNRRLPVSRWNVSGAVKAEKKIMIARGSRKRKSCADGAHRRAMLGKDA